MVTEPVLHRDTVDAFARTGWAAVPQFYDAAETRLLLDFVDELTALPERAGAQLLYREKSLLDADAKVLQRVEDICSHHDGLDRLVRRGRLFNAIEALLGEPAVLFKDKINYKESGGAGFEPHQDSQAGWSRYAPSFVTALVSLDAATVENGCLEIADSPRLPGLIGEEWKPLTDTQMQGLTFTSVPTAPGDVLFFDSFVVHRSAPNVSAHGRRVLYVTYNRLVDGDHRAQYYADKRESFPPDIERAPGVDYKFRV